MQAAGAAFLDLAGLPVGPGDPAGLGQDALLPGRGTPGGQVSEQMPGWWRSRSRQNSPPRLNARSFRVVWSSIGCRSVR